MIETSMNISVTRYEKLIAASKTLNVSIAVVLSMLIKKSRYLFRDFAKLLRTVRYQKRFEGDEFFIMNIQLFEADYEYAIGQRLLFKFSVSFFLRLAIDLYLDLIVKNGMGPDESDDKNDLSANYLQLTYEILNTDTRKHEFWGIRWDKRMKKCKKLTLKRRR